MVTRARTSAERRAKNKNNYSSDTTAVSSKGNIPQKEPGTSVSLDQTPSSNTPSKNLHHSHTPNITSTEENNPTSTWTIASNSSLGLTPALNGTADRGGLHGGLAVCQNAGPVRGVCIHVVNHGLTK